MFMLKKIVIIFALLLLVVYVGLSIAKKKYGVSKQSIITSVMPPAADIKKELPQGSDLDKPLVIPNGFRMAVFADLSKYGSPRVLQFDPSGILVVSLTKNGMVVALPDKNNDGIADEVVTVAKGLDKPHGIAFNNGKIYIAETNRVARYDYDPVNYKLSNKEVLFTLPGGGRHFTRTIVINDEKLYTSIGSSCNVCIEKDSKRASIWVSNLDGSDLKIFAYGLRNTVFFAFDSQGQMWGNDMGRDYLGDDLPPDELNIIKSGGNYGWPYCYGDNTKDTSFSGSNSHLCNDTVVPTYKYQAHVAPLGITFINSPLFPNDEQGNILAAFHGSWNRTTPVGYKIVELSIKDNKATNLEDFVSGWLTSSGGVLGRPVDLKFGSNGVLYISDDKANLIYMLTKPSE